MTDEEKMLDVIRDHVDYYEVVFVFCRTCGKEFEASFWDNLQEAKYRMAEHWIAEHDE